MPAISARVKTLLKQLHKLAIGIYVTISEVCYLCNTPHKYYIITNIHCLQHQT